MNGRNPIIKGPDRKGAKLKIRKTRNPQRQHYSCIDLKQNKDFILFYNWPLKSGEYE